jgi:outer membrane protein assembly factor BamB
MTLAAPRPALAQRPPTSVVQDAVADPGVVPPGRRSPPPAQPGADGKGDKTSPGGLPLFPLRVRWSVDLEAPPAAGVATDNVRLYVPLASGTLVAFDAETGTTRWKVDLTTRVKPAAADERVYVVSGDTLQALDGASGRAVWRVPLPAAVSAPLVARAGWLIAALENGEVLALRGTDGTIVWRQQGGAPVVAAPAIDGDRLYLPGPDGAVKAVAVATGEVIWTRTVGGAIITVAPLGPRVYVGSTDNYFYCLDDKQGRVRWRWRAGADAVGTAIADEDRVFFAALDGLVRALDRGHGAQRWRQALPWRPRTGPLRVGQTLVASGIALDLRGYALATGRPVGEYALSESRLEVLEGAPIVVSRTTLPGDFVVAALADGRLVALEHVFGLPGRPLTDLPGERVALTPPPPPSE